MQLGDGYRAKRKGLAMSNDFQNIHLGGLWEKTTQNGEKFLSGKLGMANISIFRVKEKRSENSPDYRIVLSQKNESTNRGDRTEGWGALQSAHETTHDDLPF